MGGGLTQSQVKHFPSFPDTAPKRSASLQYRDEEVPSKAAIPSASKFKRQKAGQRAGDYYACVYARQAGGVEAGRIPSSPHRCACARAPAGACARIDTDGRTKKKKPFTAPDGACREARGKKSREERDAGKKTHTRPVRSSVGAPLWQKPPFGVAFPPLSVSCGSSPLGLELTRGGRVGACRHRLHHHHRRRCRCVVTAGSSSPRSCAPAGRCRRPEGSHRSGGGVRKGLRGEGHAAHALLFVCISNLLPPPPPPSASSSAGGGAVVMPGEKFVREHVRGRLTDCRGGGWVERGRPHSVALLKKRGWGVDGEPGSEGRWWKEEERTIV